MLLELLALGRSGVLGGTMNVACPRVPSSGWTDATTMCTLATAVGGPGLGPVEHPLVGRLVVARPGADRADVGAARAPRNRTRRGGDRRSAEHLRQPLAELLGGAAGGQRRRPARSPGSTARCRRHPRTAPRRPSAARCRTARRTSRRTTPGCTGRPWPLPGSVAGRLLPLVPFGGRRAHHVGRELVHPVAHAALRRTGPGRTSWVKLRIHVVPRHRPRGRAWDCGRLPRSSSERLYTQTAAAGLRPASHVAGPDGPLSVRLRDEVDEFLDPPDQFRLQVGPVADRAADALPGLGDVRLGAMRPSQGLADAVLPFDAAGHRRPRAGSPTRAGLTACQIST